MLTPTEPIIVARGVDELPMCPVCGDKPSHPQRAPFCSWDCWDAVHCECCGVSVDTGCGCEIETVDGYDRETGPYTDTGCRTHNVRI